MQSLGLILLAILNVAWWILIIHIIMSWLIQFEVLNLRQPLVAQIWRILNQILEPVYSRIRQFVPPIGGMDFSPIIAFLALYALRVIIFNNLVV